MLKTDHAIKVHVGVKFWPGNNITITLTRAIQQDGAGVIGTRPAASRHMLCYVLYIQTGKSQRALLCRVYGLHHGSLTYE